MKTFLASVFFVFLFVFASAQDLLLSEDFDYPIGSTLNQHNWKPLTTSTDNPIKVVNGLSSVFDFEDWSSNSNKRVQYSSLGGAALLNKSGQDIMRSFPTMTSGTIYLSFQINPFSGDMQTVSDKKGYWMTAPNPSNYFMFLSTKEEPTKPLLKFAIIDLEVHTHDGKYKYYERQLCVLNEKDKILATLFLNMISMADNNPTNIKIMYSFAGHLLLSSDGGAFSLPNMYNINDSKINALSNIVLAQSDKNTGSTVKIDRIRISKSLESIMPSIINLSENQARKTATENDLEEFDINVFPNIMNNEINLSINNAAPQGEMEVRVTNNQGFPLYEKIGEWEAMKPEIEKILSQKNEGQYYFSLKQGDKSKIIRVFKQE